MVKISRGKQKNGPLGQVDEHLIVAAHGLPPPHTHTLTQTPRLDAPKPQTKVRKSEDI